VLVKENVTPRNERRRLKQANDILSDWQTNGVDNTAFSIIQKSNSTVLRNFSLQKKSVSNGNGKMLAKGSELSIKEMTDKLEQTHKCSGTN
jgi:hypothetical protein